ncbi:Uncharacterised protein [Legionella busanensis]|uniref:DUF4239 domain-containing protein n=1 Tax=Legionella busanensis TaxID=190655 RepID=A0A378JMI8_9GAMM|nr:DUF4239 domain-containing protein [Legionella busanensis]STX52444.1 Uncharacterised protein [Legionella busanensis]
MARELINAVPFWWLVILCISVLTIISYLAVIISTQLITVPIDKDHRSLSNALIRILSTGFSVLLAFIIINTWNYLLETQDDIATEADALAAMVRNINVFPAPEKNKLMAGIRDYTILVRTQEWTLMKEGKESPDAWNALNNLFFTLQSFDPKTNLEKIYYSQCLKNLDTILNARRDRLSRLTSIIPEKLSSSLIIGSIFLVVILGLIRGESGFLNTTPILFFSIVFGFNVAIALSFDYPYSGDISVSNRLFYEGMLSSFKDPSPNTTARK